MWCAGDVPAEPNIDKNGGTRLVVTPKNCVTVCWNRFNDRKSKDVSTLDNTVNSGVGFRWYRAACAHLN